MDQTPTPYTRSQLADMMLARLDETAIKSAREQFRGSGQCQWFSIDDLLPEGVAREIYEAFPDPRDMRERKTLREHKYVAAQMNKYHPLGEEALFAFHDPRVVAEVSKITEMDDLHADPKLYAGGLSLMGQHNFLNPHLDNSHNHDRSLYRVLNLLYYVSPQWREGDGGNLELWPGGVRGSPVRIHSKFNRLVVMTTGPDSWHSVSPVQIDSTRCCVSNYYFSPIPVGGKDYFRVTTFRGRPEQPGIDLLLRADAALRQALRIFKPSGVVQTTHLYQRPDDKK